MPLNSLVISSTGVRDPTVPLISKTIIFVGSVLKVLDQNNREPTTIMALVVNGTSGSYKLPLYLHLQGIQNNGPYTLYVGYKGPLLYHQQRFRILSQDPEPRQSSKPDFYHQQ